MRTGLGAAIAVWLSLTAASARAELRIIDVSPHPPKHNKSLAPAAPPPPTVPDVQLVMNDSETTRNLSAGVSALLGSMGYVVAPEVDYERMKTSRNAKVMLRFEVVRMGGACFITAKAAELKTQSIFFWRWETKDDSKACAEQLKASVEEYFKARAPSKLPPGADAGVDLDGGLEKAMAKVVLPLTLVEPEMAPLAPAGPDASDRVDAAAPPAPTKKCGCGESGAPMAAAALLAALALRRRLSLV